MPRLEAPMADSKQIPRHTLNIPERGQDTYLAETKALGMWRHISVKHYPASRVSRLLTAAKAGACRFYTSGLYSLEMLARPNG